MWRSTLFFWSPYGRWKHGRGQESWQFHWSSTDSDGYVTFEWTATESGTYSINASFAGSASQGPCETCACVNASVMPLATLFDVSTHEFTTLTNLLLNATIINISTNQTMTGPNITVQFFSVCSNGSTQSLGTNLTYGSGTATLNYVYPGDGKAYAFTARIVPAGSGTLYQGIACNPLQLTVSKSTKLLLNVTRDWSSGNHTIEGWLLNATSGISGKQVKIAVNGTEYLSSVTNASGYFRLSLNLRPADNNATTYTITASFEDAAQQPINVTAWANTLDGQQYPACTTFQYGYKPAYNTTMLTVLPQSTEALTMTTSPEEVQKQAQDSGWMPPPKPEFSWLYPWFRLHFIGQYKGTKMIDVGVAPLPFGDTGFFPDTPLKRKTDEQFRSILSSIVLGMIVGEGAVLLAERLGPWVFIPTVISYFLYKVVTLLSNWNSVSKLWENLLANFISIAISAFGAFEQFFSSAFRALAAGTAKLQDVALGFVYRIITIPLNIYLLMTTWDRLVALGGV